MAVATRRRQSTATYQHCARMAAAAGLRLIRHSETHYSLFGPETRPYMLDVFPARLAYVADQSRPEPPRLWFRMPRNWTLIELVNAAIAAKGR